MALIKCPECGNSMSDKARKCPECGYENNFIYCPECGTQIKGRKSSCPECGFPIREDNNNQRVVYALPMNGQAIQGNNYGLSVTAIVFSLIIPFVGLILGIIAICTNNENTLAKRNGKIALTIFFIELLISVIIIISLFSQVN